MKKITNRKDLFWVLLLSIIVLLPNIYLAAVGNDLAEKLFMKATFLLISAVIFCIPALFLKAKYFFLFEGIFVLFAPIEIAHIYLNKMGVTTGFMMALFDTDWHEATELLTSIPIIFWQIQ